MSKVETIKYHQYLPPGVQRVIASGISSWVGIVDESTILKFAPQPGGNTSRLEIEGKIPMIYFIMTGHCFFPDIVDGKEGWTDKVRDRFENGQFPEDFHTCNWIVLNSWNQRYNLTYMVLRDLEAAKIRSEKVTYNAVPSINLQAVKEQGIVEVN